MERAPVPAESCQTPLRPSCLSGSAQGSPPSDFQCPFLVLFTIFCFQTNPTFSKPFKQISLCLNPSSLSLSTYHNKQFSLFTIKFKCCFHSNRISFEKAISKNFLSWIVNSQSNWGQKTQSWPWAETFISTWERSRDHHSLYTLGKKMPRGCWLSLNRTWSLFEQFQPWITGPPLSSPIFTPSPTCTSWKGEENGLRVGNWVWDSPLLLRCSLLGHPGLCSVETSLGASRFISLESLVRVPRLSTSLPVVGAPRHL